MKTFELLARLRSLGVEVWEESGRLRYRAPEGALTADLLAEMSRRKAGILDLLRQARGSAGLIPRVPREGELPLSFAQQRLWFLHQLQPDSPVYNEAGLIVLAGELEIPALARGLEEIVRRHEVLRTTFESAGGRPRQVIHPPAELPLPRVDLDALPAGAGRAEARRLAAEQARLPFDLVRGPLLRTVLLRLGEAEHHLLLTMHHLVNDGWSLRGVFAPELAALYEARAPLPELPVQYADFAAWQRQWLAGERLEGELAYWRRQLAGPPMVIELPTDRPRSAAQSFRGAHLPLAIPRELQAALEERSRREGVTLFATLLAALQTLLFRYSGQEDVRVGVPTAGRPLPELAGLIGFFINTQVLRVFLAGEISFREVLERVRASLLGAQTHQNVPFERLVEELQPERGPGVNPFFQVMFAFQSDPKEALSLPGLEVSFHELETGTAKFDLGLSLETSRRGLDGFLQYATDLFDRPSILRLAGHFTTLLAAVAADPGRRISELPLLTEGERHQLLADWNDTEVPDLGDLLLHHFFEARADAEPGVVAATFGAEALSYGELERRANRLARRLRSLGVGPEARVAVSLERSLEMIVAILGVLKAGGAYVPLDPAYPEERLTWMLEDCGAPVLLTQEGLGTAWCPAGTRVLSLGPAGRGLEAESGERPADLAIADNLAYSIYTSGSTGRPKGVLIRHRSISRVIRNSVERFGLPPRSRVLQLASLSFDASVLEIFLALATGSTVALLDQVTRSSPVLVGELLRRDAIGCIMGPTAFLDAIPGDFPALTTLIVGGDACSRETVARWSPGRGFFNCYAPTETTIFSTLYPCRPAPQAPPLGRPIPAARVYLADARMELVPVGVVGELYVGGVGLARGYLGRPELTAERFPPDPFSAEPGARLYRTGDLARLLPDGNLIFVGRNDLQVKVRGLRIELEEIEARLIEHPGVRDAAAAVRRSGGDPVIAAYYVPVGEPVDAGELRAFVSERLPAYMVPGRFVRMPALPLTANGKLDRRTLPELDDATAEAGGEAAQEPRTPVEALVAEIAAGLLGRQRVGTQESFFALGGHSLLVIQLLSRIRDAFQVELPVDAVFNAPSLAALARQIEEARRPDGAPGGAPALERAPLPERPPLSFAQQRLWFLDQFEPGDPAYNMVAAFRLEGALRVGALAGSLRELARRHDSLRTTFAAVQGEAHQVIAPALELPLPVVDLGGPAAAARDAEVRALARREARRPFDLGRGPLLRVALLRLGPAEHVLLLGLHHIVADGASIEILFRELGLLYEAAVLDRPSPLPPLPLRYADFALWQRRWLREDRLASHLAYWRERLAGAPPRLELPTDRPRPAVQRTLGGTRRRRLRPGLGAALQELGRGEGVTRFMALVAGLAALLSRYSGQLDIVLGSPTANRNQTGIEGIVGFFVNTEVLRVDLTGEPGFRELLARVRTVALEAHAHQDLPFERLVEELRPERDLSGTPLFQVLLVLQATPEQPAALSGLRLSPIPFDTGTAKFDLTWTVDAAGDGLDVELKYRADLFEGTTALRLLAHFERLLGAAVADAGLPVAGLPLLAPAEEHQVAREWNDTGAGRSAFQPVHRQVAAWAARVPGEIAVVAGEGEAGGLRFGELEAAASRLARHLRRLGAGAESVVALCLERSPEMVAGVLGILKAGAAYLPLDPAQPPRRLAAILEESGAAILLTRSDLLTSLSTPPGLRRLCVDADAADIARERADDPGIEILPEQLAYVIYTSGSTGRPKGVMIRHSGLANLLEALESRIYRGQWPLRVGLNAPLAFDASVKQWIQLARGRTLCLLPEDARRDGGEMLAWIDRHRVEALDVTPVQARMLLDAGLARGSALRLALVAGEALGPELWNELAALGEIRFFDVYGPTECTVDATACAVDPGRPVLGRTLENVHAVVLDPGQRPVPAGVPGELCIGGAGIARGYLGRPDLTAERFLPDPYGEPGARLYRSGDLARRLADGRIEFLGRVDHQVKLRGYRIELGEVEASLALHPDVRQAAADVRKDPAGHPRLVAWVAGRDPGGLLDPQDLRRFLRQRLPEYMVPAIFLELEDLPVTRGGKVDRRALPDPDRSRAAGEAPLPPRDEVEEALCRIWSRVLGVDAVDVRANFFELGGDSILSIQVAARAQEEGLGLTPKLLFQHQTLAELARAVPVRRRPAVAPEAVAGPLPLTPVQRRFFELGSPDPDHYNQALLLTVRPPADPERLERAVAGWLRRHAALRLRFQFRGGEWSQAHGEEGVPPFTRIDLAGLPAARRSGALDAATGEIQAGLDLARGPLLRTALFQLGDGGPDRFLAVVHHLAVDGVSWRILVEDLEREDRQTSSPPAATATYAAWAGRLAAYVPPEEERAFWAAMAESPATSLPRDLDGGAGVRAESRHVAVELDAGETLSLLQEVPKACKGRPEEVLLAAVAQALAAWSGGPVPVALEGHGREELFPELDLSRTVGWFTAVYPLALDLGGAVEPWQALRTVKTRLRAVPRGGVGHGVLGFPAPRPEVVFNYLGRVDRLLPDGSAFLSAEPAAGEQSPRTPRRYLLEVQAAVRDGRLRIEWHYGERAHRRETVERLAEACRAALRALIAQAPERGIEGLAPADFPLARLDQPALDHLLEDGRPEDVYPLSHLQEGMLFQHLYERSESYFEQIALFLEGEVDEAALRRSWQSLVDRHPVLRTSFAWQGMPSPLQRVAERAALPWESLDWRAAPAAGREARLEAFLRGDRERGFDLAVPPLMRVCLIRTADAAFVCVWSHHHLLLDGWSLPVLFRELFEGYRAALAGRPFAPPPPRPYRDYIAHLQDRDLAAAEAWWRGALAGFTAAPALGIDRSPGAPPDAGRAPRQALAALSAAETLELQTLARRQRLTLNTLVAGAWALLLSRYGGSEDVVYGATLSGRSLPLAGVESMVGLFINTLPVRVRVEESSPVSGWLLRLQEQQAELRQFETVSLVEAQGWSEVRRGQPLFETLLVFENYPLDAGRLEDMTAGCGFEIAGFRVFEKSGYPLNLVCTPDRRLSFRLLYDGERFEAAAVSRLLEHLRTLLASLPAAAGSRLEDLSLFAPAERHQILFEWNDTASALPADAGIPGLFERQADRAPEAEAIVWGSFTLTYRELDRRANRLARHLRSVGAGPGSRIGLHLRRSPEMVVAMLAVLKSGGAYVPLDPVYPPERLAFMAEDAGLTAVLTEESLAATAPAGPAPAIRVDADAGRIASWSEARLAAGVAGGDLAYLIYTSGSTGRPKGVAVPHRAVVRLVLETDYVQLTPADRVAQASNASFDAATFEIWGALLCGARLVGIDKEIALSPAGFAAELRDRGVTALFLTTALFNQLAAEAAVGFRPLRHLLFGGEAVDPGQVRRVLREGAPERLLHVYGPTENTTFSTWFRVAGVAEGAATVSIGRPIANSRMLVLDRAGLPVPAGIVGELFLGGDGLAQGYWNRPGPTAASFLPDAFSGEPGARLYRTGDLVRQRPGGDVEFVGRVDHQVKLRGFRIELGEIESALTRHPGVREAAVLVRETGGDRRLVAWVVPAPPARPAVQDLREHLLGILPEYQVPAAFVLLDALPLTPNGKVDRRALPDPEAGEVGSATAFVAPRTPAEEILAGLWAQVLGVDRVGLDDDFFALGGHSLLATRLISRVCQTFGIDLSIRSLFEAPALEAFAREVEKAQAAAAGAPPLEPVLRRERLPLSFAQHRLWFLDWLVPEDPTYNIVGALRLAGRLDARALDASLREIVRRHEVLRTTFPVAPDGEPYQLVAEAPGCDLALVDLQSLPEARRMAEVLELSRREALRPFDLARGPLLRMALLRLAGREHALVVTLHHIIADGWSIAVLARELGAIMDAIAAGEPPALPVLPVQYADYAVWQRRWLTGEVLEARLAFWRERLAGAPAALELPLDRPRPRLQTSRGEAVSFELSAELTGRLQALSRERGVTLFMTLLGGFQALLWGLTGRTDLLVGTTVANRLRTEVENLIGLFVNLVPLRTDLAGDPTFAELLGRVREAALGAYAHQEVPFEKIVDAVQLERDLSRPPLVQVALALNDARMETLELAGLSVIPLAVDNGTAKFDLIVYLSESGGGLRAQARYNADLFDRATMARLGGAFETVLRAAAGAPGGRLSTIPVLGEAERHQVTVEWQGGPAVVEPLFHEAFEAWAEAAPDLVALTLGGDRLTYGELNDRANRLSRHLAVLGVGPEVRVGLFLERSMELIVSILAVFKAGGAYVPIDPAYPPDRVDFILEDSAGQVLLSTGELRPRLHAVPPGCRVVLLDAEEAAIAAGRAGNPGRRMDSSNLAYVIYTSGSTGRPKGVQVPYRGLANLTAESRRIFATGPGSRVLQFFSSSFDASVWEYAMALAAGATLCLVRREEVLPGPELLDRLEALEITHVTLPPSAIAVLVERELPHLVCMMAAGEACPPALPARWGAGRSFCNGYGPTEITIATNVARIVDRAGLEPHRMPIGPPIAGAEMWVLDGELRPVPIGVPGDLWLGGVGVTRGYLRRPELTADRFVPHPFSAAPGARLYRSGDLARWLPTGEVEFLGRKDGQVKVRGFRIELGEIEAALLAHPEVRQAAATVHEGPGGLAQLVAYLVPRGGRPPRASEIRAWLAGRLPEPMVPSLYVEMESLPVSPNGKIDRKALPAPAAAPAPGRAPAPAAGVSQPSPLDGLEAAVARIWREVLERDEVGIDDNFFDLGGHSLLLARIHARLRNDLASDLPVVELFQHPTVRTLARRLRRGEGAGLQPEARRAAVSATGEVAVVGMAGRFPGAGSIAAFWRNLAAGVESISFFSPEELIAAGVDPALVADPGYVRAKGVLQDPDLFDAPFFGFTPRDAALTDPQQRLFLECAWEALEDAGCDPVRQRGDVGVFAGVSTSGYALDVHAAGEGGVNATVGNDKDFLATRVSYKLNLTGPSLVVQSACSTSLVAVHLACRSLLAGECDVALAGGASVRTPLVSGYRYEEGGILSPDGHCRAFDARAAGTVGGHGVGVVVLKRLADALADGDTIRAVVKGSAINNDGGAKIGYTAPSVEGQAAVIAQALAAAGVEPRTLGYIETHGTGTPLGDPIEIAALKRVFSAGPDGDRCALGSLKSNIGHLDAAAGVAGLIKAVLALEHRQLPPSLHFERPNPGLGIEESPLYVNDRLQPWEARGGARRAGVSSFGIGGTNAHVVLEEAPPAIPAAPGRPWQLLTLSARTPAALEAASRNLARHVEEAAGETLPDLAYTLQTGRRAFDSRRVVLCQGREDALAALRGQAPERVWTGRRPAEEVAPVFLFPGQGAQLAGAGADLHRDEPAFRRRVDACCEILRPLLGLDLRELLFPVEEEREGAELRLQQTWLTQPAVFVIAHAAAGLWMEWGVRPRALIGHSVGEYVAACLAGVIGLEDALALVAARGRLMQDLPPGAMVSVALSPEELEPWLGEELSLAAINGPRQCVAAGPVAAVEELERRLADLGVAGRRLAVTRAFHSAMMEPVLESFLEEVRGIDLRPPEIPFLSNLTGGWIRPEEATDPDYWARHLRGTVRFADGLEELLRDPRRILLEVGPGRGLSTLARRHPAASPQQVILTSLTPERTGLDAAGQPFATLGRLWLAGVEVDWDAFHAGERRRKVPAPTYPFERQRYWIETSRAPRAATARPGRRPLSDWFYLPSWRRTPPPSFAPAGPAREEGWLVFGDGSSLAAGLVRRLREEGRRTVEVRPGEGFAAHAGGYVLDPGNAADYERLLEELEKQGIEAARVLHLWTLTPGVDDPPADRLLALGFYSLLFLGQALGARGEGRARHLGVISNRFQTVSGDEPLCPAKATLVGPCRTLPVELPGLHCTGIDVIPPAPDSAAEHRLIDALLAEVAADRSTPVVAYRGVHRWVQDFEPAPLAEPASPGGLLRPGGVYLITGGLGGVGLALAAHLAETARAKLILLGRSLLPPREEWKDGQTDPRIDRLLALEELGAEVEVVCADVADLEQTRAAVARGRRRFGPIHGVIHAAGLPGGGLIRMASPETAARVLAPKVQGTLVLDEVFRDEALDFLVLCSSQSALIGMPGRADYTAANAFLGAFAQARSGAAETFTIAVDWDTWTGVGMAAGGDPAIAGELPGMTVQEGVEVFRRVLHSRLPQVVVSSEDLPSVVERFGALAAMALAERAPDRGTLPSRPDLATPYVAPSFPAEQALAEIWQELLGIAPVGVDDNFFELGGDSVLGIQVAARAKKRGLLLTPKQVFDHQTVGALAGVARRAGAQVEDQGLVTGDLPLLPVQRWFFSLGLADPHHWNQSVLLGTPAGMAAGVLGRAVERLLAHHDALRLRFLPTAAGWRARLAEPGEEAALAHVDLARLPSSRRGEAIGKAAGDLQRSLDLTRGPLARFAWFDPGPSESGRLLIAVHHLAVDFSSWRILLEDLAAACEALAQGAPPILPAKTSSLQRWARHLSDLSLASETRRQAAYWCSGRRAGVRPLPVDDREGSNRLDSAETVAVSLTPDETAILLRDVPRLHRAQVEEALVTGVALALARWTGQPLVLIEMEGEGREVAPPDLDLARTVGWLTLTYPALFDLEGVMDDPGTAFRRVREQLREIPGRGLGHGLLRHPETPDEESRMLAALPAAEVLFVYVGRMEEAATGSSGWFRRAPEPAGAARSPRGTRTHLLEVQARVADGCLWVDWTYSRDVHGRPTIQKLAETCREALKGLIDLDLSARANLLAPADFPLARIGRSQLAELAARFGPRIEDLYGLSPLQHGLLFESLYAPESEVYLYQLHWRVTGDLEIDLLERALQRVVDRHPVLRSAFLWEGLDEPLQAVLRETPARFDVHDWRSLPADELEKRLDAFLTADRALGFALADPPLMRLSLVRTGERACELAWLHHHLILDGWSAAIVLQEVFSCYEAMRQGREVELEPVRSYRDHIAWLRGQDLFEAERFWRRVLAGFTSPTPLPGGRSDGVRDERESYAERELLLAADPSRELEALARGHQITLNVLVQGLWALLLSYLTGEEDVVFGATVAGRPPALEGVESMVGLFINTLPVRSRISPQTPLLAAFRALQEHQAELLAYEYSPLAEVRGWSDVPPGRPLFESNLVFESFPMDAARLQPRGGLEILPGRSPGKANSFPLVLVAKPGERLSFWLIYDRRRFEEGAVSRLVSCLEELLRLLTGLTDLPGTTVGDLFARLHERLESLEAIHLRSARERRFSKVRRKTALPGGDGDR